MALNWGHKITIVLILFGVLMLTLVYMSIKTDFQLVSKDYYKDELKYQQIIDGSNNAAALSSPVTIAQSDNNITIQFPLEMKGKLLEGSIWFYCAYNDQNDRHIKIDVTNNAIQTIERSKLSTANYIIKTNWKADGKNYYNEQSFSIK
jgi:hypothetical protein